MSLLSMLGVRLMSEAATRYGSGPGWRAVVDDAADQRAYCLDAPSAVHDGVEWYQNEDIADCCGVVPRSVAIRAG